MTPEEKQAIAESKRLRAFDPDKWDDQPLKRKTVNRTGGFIPTAEWKQALDRLIADGVMIHRGNEEEGSCAAAKCEEAGKSRQAEQMDALLKSAEEHVSSFRGTYALHIYRGVHEIGGALPLPDEVITIERGDEYRIRWADGVKILEVNRGGAWVAVDLTCFTAVLKYTEETKPEPTLDQLIASVQPRPEGEFTPLPENALYEPEIAFDGHAHPIELLGPVRGELAKFLREAPEGASISLCVPSARIAGSWHSFRVCDLRMDRDLPKFDELHATATHFALWPGEWPESGAFKRELEQAKNQQDVIHAQDREIRRLNKAIKATGALSESPPKQWVPTEDELQHWKMLAESRQTLVIEYADGLERRDAEIERLSREIKQLYQQTTPIRPVEELGPVDGPLPKFIHDVPKDAHISFWNPATAMWASYRLADMVHVAENRFWDWYPHLHARVTHFMIMPAPVREGCPK